MEEAIAIVKKYRDNVLGMSMCEQIQRAVLNSIIEDLEAAQQTFAPDPPSAPSLPSTGTYSRPMPEIVSTNSAGN